MSTTFAFMKPSERIMYQTAYDAITQLELWEYMKTFNGNSVMFSTDVNITRIYKKIVELGYNEHSGASFGYTIRAMEVIAKDGISLFIYQYNNGEC